MINKSSRSCRHQSNIINIKFQKPNTENQIKHSFVVKKLKNAKRTKISNYVTNEKPFEINKRKSHTYINFLKMEKYKKYQQLKDLQGLLKRTCSKTKKLKIINLRQSDVGFNTKLNVISGKQKKLSLTKSYSPHKIKLLN